MELKDYMKEICNDLTLIYKLLDGVNVQKCENVVLLSNVFKYIEKIHTEKYYPLTSKEDEKTDNKEVDDNPLVQELKERGFTEEKA